MELDPGGPNTDSARLAYRRKHRVAFHDGPAPAEFDAAGTHFSRGAFGDLGLIHSMSDCHGGLHSSLALGAQARAGNIHQQHRT